MKRVVITGLGALTPLGNSVSEYWDKLELGISGANKITRFDAEKFKTRFACEVKNFNVKDYIDRKEARKMDVYAQYAMVVAEQAFDDSKLLSSSAFNPQETGVIWGSGIGGLETFEKEVTYFAKGDGTPRFNPYFIPKMIADLSAGHISMKYNLQGPSYTTVSACASATNALIDALTYIQTGKVKAVISGGSEAAVTQAGIGGFNALTALSTRNDDCKTASRPFDKNRDGFVMGEGAGALVLEELEYAQARGAKIYAELIAGAMTSDAHHMTAPHPDGAGAMGAMKKAITYGGITPEEVDYINVHGTSTPLGDLAELKAIQNVFGEHAYRLNISSTKSMTGHLLGAAGAVEALASLMVIQRGVIPPTINQFEIDEEIDPKLNLTPNKAQKREVNVAMSNTFGFGGHNCSILLKKFTE